MAFWGAPAAHPRHALNCVRAAINAQRAIDELNRARADENTKRELQNFQRAAAGEMPLPALPILSLGTGINTGPALVGLMGSDKHGLNYTVFGREINLASRLEALSGRGRIFIGEATSRALQRDDPALAATCTAHAPVTVKGIRESVKMFEVPWRLPGTISPIGDDYGSASSGHDTSSTGFIRLG
jgi:adenylate cyclase